MSLTFDCPVLLQGQISLCVLNFSLYVLLSVVTGMEASVGKFTSSLGRRGLYLHMILPINMLMVMLIPIRFVSHDCGSHHMHVHSITYNINRFLLFLCLLFLPYSEVGKPPQS